MPNTLVVQKKVIQMTIPKLCVRVSVTIQQPQSIARLDNPVLFWRIIMILIRPICGFNKMVPHVRQPVKYFNYCMRHLQVAYSLVLVIRMGPLDHGTQHHQIFLWDYSKLQLYCNKPTTTRDSKEEIQCCSNEIKQNLCRIVMENFKKFNCNLKKLQSKD